MGDTRLWFHPEAMKAGDKGKIKQHGRMGKYARRALCFSQPSDYWIFIRVHKYNCFVDFP